MKKLIIAVVTILVILGIGIFLLKSGSFTKSAPVVDQKKTAVTPTAPTPQPVATTSVAVPINKAQTDIGVSVENRKITAYHYGSDEGVGIKEVMFVGGVHGGYEWNSILVVYQLMDYLKTNPKSIPQGLRVTVIPVLNPDGLFKVVGTTENFTEANVPTPIEKTVAGRYNANNVDLNRNFDCDWQASGMWQNTKVSGGSTAFSEPESKAFQSYITGHKLAAVVVWFSAAGGVFSSHCQNGVLTETSEITKIFADASGYPAHKSFDFYPTTGDMVNWLAKNNIPAISVLLTTHNYTEWSKNQAGVQALLNHYGTVAN